MFNIDTLILITDVNTPQNICADSMCPMSHVGIKYDSTCPMPHVGIKYDSTCPMPHVGIKYGVVRGQRTIEHIFTPYDIHCKFVTNV